MTGSICYVNYRLRSMQKAWRGRLIYHDTSCNCPYDDSTIYWAHCILQRYGYSTYFAARVLQRMKIANMLVIMTISMREGRAERLICSTVHSQ
jgi:hypothetical protein